MKISSSNAEINKFIQRKQMEEEKIQQRRMHNNKNTSKINFEGLNSAFNKKNGKLSGLESIMKQKEEQEEILGKLKENQSKTINSLKERFDDLKEEIDKFKKNNSDIFKQYKGIDGDLDKILGDNTSDVLNSMDGKDVSDKLGSIISSLESNGGKEKNSNTIEAFQSLNDLYKELYEVRDKAKEYLEESQQEIEKMQDKINKTNDNVSKLYNMNLIDTYDNDDSANKKNNNKISIKTNEQKKENLDVLKDEKKTVEETYDKQKAIKLDDIKNLRKEADEARKEIKERSNEIEKMNYKEWAKDKDLKNILQGNISKVKESMNFEQLQDKVRSTVELLDKDNPQMADKLRDLYSGYKKLYELDDEIEQTEKEVRTLEENKEKSNKKSSKHFYYVSSYSNVSKASVNSKDQYYNLKRIVDEMFK